MITTQTPSELNEDHVVTKHDELRQTLLPLIHKTVLDSGFRFDGFNTVIDLKADATYPLVTYLAWNHVSLDGYAENEALSMNGIEDIGEWLNGLGLLNGEVEFRLNLGVPADED